LRRSHAILDAIPVDAGVEVASWMVHSASLRVVARRI
jgi:hypothetical protein